MKKQSNHTNGNGENSRKLWATRLDPDVLEDLRKHCHLTHLSRQQITEDALRFYFGSTDKELLNRRDYLLKQKAATR